MQRQNDLIKFRCSAELKERLKEAASEQGRTISALLRGLANDQAEAEQGTAQSR